MPSGLSKETTQMLKLHCTTSLGRGDLSLVAGRACPRTLCEHRQMSHYLCTASWSGSPSELSSSTGVTAGAAWRETGRKSSRWRFFRRSSYSRNRTWDRPFCSFSYLRNFPRTPGLYRTFTGPSSFPFLPRSGGFNLDFFL